MAKQWFFEVMGEPIGPFTSAELILRAHKGDVLPDTRVRIGTDGKWQLAARVKGLFPLREAAPPREAAAAAPQSETQSTVSAVTPAETDAAIPLPADPLVTASATPKSDPVSNAPSPPREYEFYDMVGFEDALGHALYGAVREYVRERGLTMTAVNRQALAEFIGRPELGTEQPQPVEAAAPPLNSISRIV